MDEFSVSEARRDAERAVCAVCNEPVVSTDAVVYLSAEKLLMHRRCCDAHPSCRCEEQAPPTASRVVCGIG